ncbi:MAG: ferrous iron transport protein B [Tannerellaceae bacterium]|jgi:ferrous iron transport protein B|nr:ferrous iron transport protein B [Tannerellaceae bacterium]
MKLSGLKTGERGVVVKVAGRGAFRKRIVEMGFVRGKEVEVVGNAPLNDPIHYRVMGYDVSLRRSEASLIEIVRMQEGNYANIPLHGEEARKTTVVDAEDWKSIVQREGRTIHVALVGNPNCGKTSLFNMASGLHEHTGNYSGVTVDAKMGRVYRGGYTFEVVDLPGTYSLSTYTPEEVYVRNHLQKELPDVVINVIDASNLERNLYLTAQLIDMDARMVIALNMYDELEKRGDRFAHESLGKMLGVPIVPTVGKTGAGIATLFDRIIQVYEEKDPMVRHVHIYYGSALEGAIEKVSRELETNVELPPELPKRYVAMRLLEGDSEVEKSIKTLVSQECHHHHHHHHAKGLSCWERIHATRDKGREDIRRLLGEDAETGFTDARYGFISGALRETYKAAQPIQGKKRTELIDEVVTHRVLGFPIFVFLMWVIFETTFRLGAYPIEWIEVGIGWLGNLLKMRMSAGPFKDLLVDGVIGGVGGVIVFLPNIVLLYLFISLMEDSGYMARAAFIMDRLMHKMGLHGKSFIPLVMGFGCTVPAIMASRTIESRNSRLVTMLVNPLMSCSARLPVYVLLTSAFFPRHGSIVMLGLYATGIGLAVVLARLFKRWLFRGEDIPFVMELPPYRMPTWRSIGFHVWVKAKQYLHKMGGIILVASILIWFLGYFPRPAETILTTSVMETEISTSTATQEESYIGRMGKAIEPIMSPLGFDWKMSVALLTGLAAKEVVVSTLGVLYTGTTEETESLPSRLRADRDKSGSPVFTPLIAFCLMLFVLIYFPCIATLTAISRESGSWHWGAFVALYSCMLAWIAAFTVKQVGTLLGW